MKEGRAASGTRHALLVVSLFAVAAASLVQPLGCAQTSHYALVRSLADGTARIDAYHERTCDDSYFEGHYYSNKSPALAVVMLPLYAALDAADAVPESWRTAVWVLGLVGVVLPAVLLLLLVRHVVERFEPGLGTVTALALGMATLVLPFATLVFSHLLAALFALASFAVLLAASADERSPRRVAAAGVLAGLAATTEYPVGLVALGLLAYVVIGGGWRRGVVFGAGGAVGLVPLALYNQWAFGSFAHLSYRYPILNAGQSGHDAVAPDAGGVFGLRLPDPDVALGLLLDQKGLLTVTPIVAVALAALVLLYRAGARHEALLIGGLAVLFVAYNSAFYNPMGGDVPGPRYLLPMLPFLAVPLATAFHRLPIVTGVLASVSALAMVAATGTEPMLGHGDTGRWAERVFDGDFTHTVVTFATERNGWLEIAPFLVALAAAAALAVAPLPLRRPTRGEAGAGLAAFAAWAVCASLMPLLFTRGGVAIALTPLVVAAAVAVVTLATIRGRAFRPAT